MKLFEPRPNTLAPRLTLRTREHDEDYLERKPEEEEEEQFDQMEDCSLPSTPLIEQLTREVAQLGNAKKKIV